MFPLWSGVATSLPSTRTMRRARSSVCGSNAYHSRANQRTHLIQQTRDSDPRIFGGFEFEGHEALVVRVTQNFHDALEVGVLFLLRGARLDFGFPLHIHRVGRDE